jgi:signal transduction histidine kinase/CheY-like chemotaxis protein
VGKKKNIAELEKRLQEAEDTLDAIRLGHVDALVVQGPEGEQVFTLKGADHRYRLLVETMTEGALLVASDGTILYANSQFARLLDRPLETIIASRLDAHVAPAQVPFVNAVLGSAGGAAARVETQLLATDRSVPVYIAVTPGAGDAPKCVIVTDLSNQKHDQEILAAERLASQIVEQSTDGLVVCDANGHVIRASMPAQRLASGNPFLVPFAVAFPMYTSSDHQVGRTVVERALEGHKLSGHEVCLEHRGEALDLLLSAGPIANSDGAIVGCVISFIDNTERKRAAEERQSLLERADEARVEAENANRAKDEFLAMLGHELRNPLAPILTALEIMHMKGDSKTERERTMIERHVKDVVRLVGDLLDVSRIAQGKVEIERRAVDTAQLIAKAVEAAAPMIEEKGHHLSVDATPDIWIEADGSRISQVLSNLLTNAAKYTPRNGHISIRSIRDGDQIVISVSDDGMGVAPALLPRLFDLFVQGRRTIDRSDGGLGLGLAIVRNLVRMHGGTVVARSEGEGRGSTFEVRLPALAATYASQVVKFEDETEAEESGTRVLVVDDNRDAADLLGEALSTLGFRARIAYDGPSALDVAANFAPDIALLDIGLPVMDGYELARRLRSQVDGSGPLRLVALTGYGSASDRAKSAAAGFDAHMVKPINLTTLATTLKNLA